MKYRSVLFLLVFLLLSGGIRAQNVVERRCPITLCNSNSFDLQQVVEVDTARIIRTLGITPATPFKVFNAAGQEVCSQITHDGKLLVFANVASGSSLTFYAVAGKPQQYYNYVHGNVYKIRKDDLAWENDRCAYRLYGPALQATGEKSYGIDVWVKNTPDTVVYNRYIVDYQGNVVGDSLKRKGLTAKADSVNLATSFHLDHGNGLDGYGVGPTLGCGAPALIDNGHLVLPYCYRCCEILDNGPLRFTACLDYGKNADGKELGEHRIVSLDRGSHFNKITVWYDNISKPVTFCAGVTLNGNGKLVEGERHLLYADPTDRPDVHGSTIFVGAFFPDNDVVIGKTPDGRNAVGMLKDYTGQPVTYYAGAAWSSYDVPDMDFWKLTADRFMTAKPITVKEEKQ